MGEMSNGHPCVAECDLTPAHDRVGSCPDGVPCPDPVATGSSRQAQGITLAKPLGSLSDTELDDWIQACKALERMAEQPPAHSAKSRRQFRKMRFEAEAEREGRRVDPSED